MREADRCSPRSDLREDIQDTILAPMLRKRHSTHDAPNRILDSLLARIDRPHKPNSPQLTGSDIPATRDPLTTHS